MKKLNFVNILVVLILLPVLFTGINNAHSQSNVTKTNDLLKVVNRNLTIVNDELFVAKEVSSSETPILPDQYLLEQNYPNPFNPSTSISFSLPDGGFVTLKVYNILGREVNTLLNEFKNAGSYQIEFNAENLSTGIYFYRLVTENFKGVRKMVVIK